MPLKKNYKTEINLLEDENVAKKNKIKKEMLYNLYNYNVINYKFPGPPIIGYQGYIPQKKFFDGISNSKIINIVSSSGLYLSDMNKEKDNIKTKKGNNKRSNEKIIIYCEDRQLTKKDIIKKSILKRKNDIDKMIDENKSKRKKTLYTISKEYKEIKNLFLDSSIEKIIKNAFYKTNGNIETNNYIYYCGPILPLNYEYGYENKSIWEYKEKFRKKKIIYKSKDERNSEKKKNKYFFLNRNRLFINESYNKYKVTYNEHIFTNFFDSNHKRYYKKNDNKFPNVFDSLFSIRKVGFNIEVTQHDISEILEPYLEEKKFKELLNHVYPSKQKNDLPENWKKLLNLTNLYPTFGLNKLQVIDNRDSDLGMIKLHKEY